jgi:hypothetical protein
VRWTGVKNLTIALGIKNLFDRAPPFTNQTFTFQNGYDPSYADPRGAFWYANVVTSSSVPARAGGVGERPRTERSCRPPSRAGGLNREASSFTRARLLR